MPILSIVIRLLVACVLTWLAVIDVRSRRLPTFGVLTVGGLFFVDAAAVAMPLSQILLHAGVALATLLVCAALFAARVLGGGDAKLASVVFLWTGATTLLSAFTLISISGMLVSFVSLATKNMHVDTSRGAVRALAMFSGARGVPYGVALAVGGGTVIVLPALLPLFSAFKA